MAEKQDRPAIPKSTYQAWLVKEGIPVVTGYAADVRTVATGPWRRRGGLGAYIDLVGAQETNNAYVADIPPGGKLTPEKHLYEELIYVVSGEGRTEVWQEGQPKQGFDWQAGSLFSPPLNTWHQDFNKRQDMPARYLAVTTAPLVFNLFHSEDFVFNDSYVFSDRYDGRQGYFDAGGKVFHADSLWHELKGKPTSELVLDWNFIPDIRTAQLKECEKGPGSEANRLSLAGNTMGGHIIKLMPGTYATAHRHAGGAHVLWLSGKGYTLIWPEGGKKVRIDWHDGIMLVPPGGWFHQHFVTGKEPALHLALLWRSRTFPAMGNILTRISLLNRQDKTDDLTYEDDEPEIRKQYEDELRKEGLVIKM